MFSKGFKSVVIPSGARDLLFSGRLLPEEKQIPRPDESGLGMTERMDR
jgi:hypothetical protein